MKKSLILGGGALALIALLAVAGWIAQSADDPGPPPTQTAKLSPQERIARGAYLAKAGDCMACHTTRGGAQYAGGRALPTPFGNVLSPNITPDQDTGIGSWTADDFWHALHNGKSRNGRLLYPAFPFPNYARVSRDDADALFAYLQSLPAVRQPNQPHQLRFPYNQQIMLAGWRMLYFRPAVYRDDPRQSASWNRGAYLVEGLGHCNACHSPRNALGASDKGLSGGLIPVLGWYAPSLTADSEAGLGEWMPQHISQLLKTGVSPRATVFGPMAEVVSRSLQHLSDADIDAMAAYLKTLPGNQEKSDYERDKSQAAQDFRDAGKRIYDKHCVDCHGASGSGLPTGYPPMDGNRALTMKEAVNPIRVVLNGGFAPGTAGNPRPYGMPPFGHVLNDLEVAQVVSYLRSAWSNNAPPVTSVDVNHYRAIPLDE